MKPEQLRTALFLLLALASGSIDAMSYLGLGRVFTANMTGNIVLLGVAAGNANAPAALRSCLALAAFIAGLIGGDRLMRPHSDAVWPAAATRTLWIEIALLVILTLVWQRSYPQPNGFGELALIVFCALAMGLQTALVSLLHVRGITTTYVTGTLTSVFLDLGQRLDFRGVAARIGTVLLLLVGAAITAACLRWLPAAAPFPAVAAAVIVAITATRAFRQPPV